MTSHNLCYKNDFAPTPRNKVHIKYSRMVASKEREEGGGEAQTKWEALRETNEESEL